VQPSTDRIANLDVLRGLGVLGILAVNVAAFAQPFSAYAWPALHPFPNEGDSATVWWATHTFFERKFVTLFSMLFGASLFLVGGERRDPQRSPVIRRRLTWLLIFGLIHGTLIWYGDILLLYAVCGLLLLFFRSWKGRTLLTVGALLYYVPTLLGLGAMSIMALAPPEAQAEALKGMQASFGTPAQIQAEIAAMQSSFAGAFQQNLDNWIKLQSMSVFGYLLPTLALMMVGMGLLKTGVFSGRAPVLLYVVMALAGAGALYAIGLQARMNMEAGFPLLAMIGPGSAANALLAPVATLGYVALVALLLKAGALGKLLSPLKAVGRMAFTNYIAQSVILTSIFWGGRGFGLFGELDRPQLAMIVAAVWMFQIVVSNLWLARFSQGPLESVWRALSFGKAGRPAPAAVPA